MENSEEIILNKNYQPKGYLSSIVGELNDSSKKLSFIIEELEKKLKEMKFKNVERISSYISLAFHYERNNTFMLGSCLDQCLFLEALYLKELQLVKGKNDGHKNVIRLVFYNPESFKKWQASFYNNVKLCRTHPDHRNRLDIEHRVIDEIKIDLFHGDFDQLDIYTLEKFLSLRYAKEFRSSIDDLCFYVDKIHTCMRIGKKVFYKELDFVPSPSEKPSFKAKGKNFKKDNYFTEEFLGKQN